MFDRLSIGSFRIHPYTSLLVLGLLVGIITGMRLARLARLSWWRFLLLGLGAELAGLLGAHWLQVCVDWRAYADRPIEVLYFWSGRAFIGAPVVALLFVLWGARRLRLPTWRCLDAMAPGVVIGHFFGRLGCCAVGCCHGYPTNCWAGVRFISKSIHPREWRGLYLHPTQLYEAAGLLVLFYGLLWLWRRRSQDGQVVLAYLMAYPVLRFGVEFFRGDVARGFVIDGLSTSQFVSLWMFAAALTALVLRVRRARAAAAMQMALATPPAVVESRLDRAA